MVIARGDIRWASLGEPAGSGPGYRRPVVDDAVATIDAFLADGRDVVVHCHHGASRTGPVLRAWLMRQHGWDEPKARSYVAERWPPLNLWNESFTELLETWH
ncbi:MAG: dual specificity protein phosphatase family protein [Actinobacteria bacterium]|nr:dual specificity protein phosphatase family protein [Actinomycetota bacterium]